MKRSIVYSIILIFIATFALAANYTIHDFGTGVMHDAKDIYRTNGRTVENDIGSNEVRINSLQTKADSTETALLQQIVLLASDYYTAAVVDGYLALKANVADVYSKTAADLLLADKATTGEVALKADQTEVDSIEASLLADIVNLATNYWTAATTKAYIDGTDEIQAAAIALKANAADVYDTAAINLLLADKADTSSVTTVSGALAAHTGEVSGAHQGSAIAIDSSGFTGNLSLADNTAQKAFAKLDALSGLPATNAITKIYGDSDVDGCETGAVWLVGTNGVTIDRTSNTFEVNIDSATKFNNYYDKAETNATIEAAIAAIPTPAGATAIEDEGTYISDNTIWEFDTTYDTTAVCIYRNRLLQPRKLFTSSVVSSKTRVVFNSAINASDEIILISNK